MTVHTKTITNAFQVFGIGPSNKWGSMVWGVDTWGGGSDVSLSVFKVLGETFTANDTWSKKGSKVITISPSLLSSLSEVSLVDSENYFHIFISNVSDASLRAITIWTEPTDPTDVWTEPTDPTTVWS